jgi:hypothetical protein
VIWLAVFAALFLVVFCVCAGAATSRARSAGDPTQVVPHWPSGGGTCTWCQVVPVEPCDCAGKCGHVRCVGDYTTLATLTAADMRLLHKWIKEGCE